MFNTLEVAQYIVNKTQIRLSHLELQRVMFLVNLDYVYSNNKNDFEEMVVSSNTGAMFYSLFSVFYKRFNEDIKKTDYEITLDEVLLKSVNRVIAIIENTHFSKWYNFMFAENSLINKIIENNEFLKIHERRVELRLKDLLIEALRYKRTFL